MDRHLLFYSSLSKTCRDILTEINNKNIRHRFILICVEKRPCPPIVDRTPFIITSTKKPLVDKQIIMFIRKIIEEEVENKDLLPYAPSPNKNFGNDYCMLDEAKENKRADISTDVPFTFIDEENSFPTNEVNKKDPRMLKKSLQEDVFGMKKPDYSVFSDPFDVDSLRGSNTRYNKTMDPAMTPSINAMRPGIPLKPQGPMNPMNPMTPMDPMQMVNPFSYQQQEKPVLPFEQISVTKPQKFDESIMNDFLQKRAEEVNMYAPKMPLY